MKGRFRARRARAIMEGWNDGSIGNCGNDRSEVWVRELRKGASMTSAKVVNWNQYWMRRQAQRNAGPVMPLGGMPSSATPASDRIRLDCLRRYVKAQLLPRSAK